MAEEATKARRHAAPQASAEATPSAPAGRRLSLAGLLPLITLLAFSLLYHLYINMFDSDFLVYREISLRRGVVEFSILHYQQWSSRTAIEAVLLLVCRYPQTFLPLDLAILACIYHCLQELFNRRRDLRLSWVIALLLCCYNMHDFDNAGIVATAINYSWPLAGVLYITLTQVRLFRGETVKWWQMVLAVIALLFGANAELLGIVCLVTGVVWLILAKLDQRPITLSVIQIAVSLFWIGWMAFCPGNALRTASATAHDFPAFATFSVLEKFYLGFVSTYNRYLFTHNAYFLVLCLVLALAGWAKRLPVWQRLFTTVPLLVYLFGLYVVPVVSKYVYRIGVFFYPLDLWEGQRGISSPLTQGAVAICIALGLICLYKDDIHDLLFNGMIYFGGMGTRVAMGFSPTLFASGDRTFMFMDVSIIMLVAYLFMRLASRERWQQVRGYIEGFITCAALYMMYSAIA